MTSLVEIRSAALQVLRPPPQVALSQWIETTIHLPQGQAQPGPMKLWPFQKALADSIGDASVERVSVLKSARVGYSSLLASVIGYHVAADLCAILLLSRPARRGSGRRREGDRSV